VILLGYVAGPLYAASVSSDVRRRVLWRLGLGCLALLLVLRGFNIYGENAPWVPGNDAVHTMMSFLNYTKYPPSLDFLLYALGIALLLLAWLEGRNNAATRVVAQYGGAPMFFYILHLYVLLLFQNVARAVVGPTHGDRFGVDQVWWIWVGSVLLAVVLYYPVSAFARFKRRTSLGWVRYF
jgi:uncharacterized membrane protein